MWRTVASTLALTDDFMSGATCCAAGLRSIVNDGTIGARGSVALVA